MPLRLLEYVPDAAVVTSRAGTIVYVNASAEVVFDYARDELVGRQVEVLVPAQAARAHVHHRQRFRFDPRTRPMGSGLDLKAVRKGGSYFSVEISLSLLDLDGEPHVIAFVRDVTARRERERLRQEAEEKVRQREDALAIAAHELRNPVSAQRLAIDLLMRVVGTGAVDDAAARLLPKVKRASERISLLVEELTELTMLRRGQLQPRLEEFDLAESVALLVEDQRGQIEGNHIDISLDLEPVVGRWDRLRIEQVVANLLTNATKYGEGKPVAVQVRSDADRARIVVEDHGPGIKPEDQERVFGQFERGERVHDGGGLGLGLYISRKIVEAHAGRLLLASTPGVGASFTVDLPRSPV